MDDVTFSAPAQTQDRQIETAPLTRRNSRSRKGRIIVPAVLAFAASLLAVGAEGQAAYASSPTVRVATWNVLGKNSAAHIKAGTRALTHSSDVFGLQEMSSERKRAAAGRGASGFKMSTDRTAVPILYRASKYTLMSQGRRLAFAAGQHVEYSSRDHKRKLGPKWVTYVHLRDRSSKRTFWVVNTHMIVGAYNTAQETKSHPRRVRLYKKQEATVTKLTDSIRATGAAVYVTCDCNVNYSSDAAPVQAMRDHRLNASWRWMTSAATHGSRKIDYVWSDLSPAKQVTGAKHGSDHSSLTVTYLRAS